MILSHMQARFISAIILVIEGIPIAYIKHYLPVIHPIRVIVLSVSCV